VKKHVVAIALFREAKHVRESSVHSVIFVVLFSLNMRPYDKDQQIILTGQRLLKYVLNNERIQFQRDLTLFEISIK
jgi:hypothetical protein